MKTKFTMQEKFDYYKKRSKDRTLTKSQRDYAKGFCRGVNDYKSIAVAASKHGRPSAEYLLTNGKHWANYSKSCSKPNEVEGRGYGAGAAEVHFNLLAKLQGK